MQESDPSLRQMMQVVCHLSNRAFNDRFNLRDAPLANPVDDCVTLIKDIGPTTLMLADARLSPDVLGQILGSAPMVSVTQVFLYGRLLEKWHSELATVEAALSDLGFVPDYGFDPNIARGFRRANPASVFTE